jgi:5'-nucleotidase (lipoprotein e(P4) family)
MTFRSLPLLVSIIACVSCSSAPVKPAPAPDTGALWVRYSAEYQALSRQVYQEATRALPRLLSDKTWSALPEQHAAADLPPAIIMDVDETTVTNIGFQFTLEPPFADWKLNKWADETVATPVAGAPDFVAAARAAGVTVFFITNRPCEPIEGMSDSCPQKGVVIRDLEEVGIAADADHVWLAGEHGWTQEKVTRRNLVARNHRVIMLFGDDLGDFLPCVRTKLYAPCTEAATADSRRRMVEDNSAYWGNGWYVLANPVYGSWTSVVP